MRHRLVSLLGIVLLFTLGAARGAYAQGCGALPEFHYNFQIDYIYGPNPASFYVIDTFEDLDGDSYTVVINPQTGKILSCTITPVSGTRGTSPVPLAPLSALPLSPSPRTETAATGGVAAGLSVTADFNRDGDDDFAVISGNSVTIYLGTGNISTPFKIGGTYPVGQAPNAIVAADMNGDGIPDLVTVNQNDFTGSVLLGIGNGTFQTQKTFSTAKYPITLAIADFNGDGKPDIAVAAQAGISVFPGNGDGTIGNPVTVSSQTTFAMVAADFNGDSKPDILFTGGDSGLDIYVLPGNGAGGFGAALVSTGVPQSVNSAYFGFAYGDFNHDGLPDLVASRRGYADVYLGQGGGKFAAGIAYATGYSTDPAFAIDNNGDPYLVTVDSINQLLTFVPGNPDGTLKAPRAYYTNSLGTAVVGDFDGDGKIDVVDVGYNGANFSLTVMTNSGAGTFTVATPPPGASPGGLVLAVTGDFNGDGKPDVAAAAGNSNSVAVFEGTGSGGFQSAITTTVSSGTVGAIAAADFNGDGKTDLAVLTQTTGSSTVSLELATGAGTFSAGSTVKPPAPASDVAAGDVNGDGKPDLVVATPSSSSAPTAANVTVFLNQGNGTFGPGVAYAAGYGSTGAGGVVKSFLHDVNGDGKPDLVVITENSNSGAALAVLLGNGDGTFQSAKLFSTAFGPNSLVFGDFNGDGKIDLVVAHCCGDTALSVLYGNGDGTFQTESEFPGGYSAPTVLTADFNGDGKPDLLAASQTGYDVVLLNTAPSFAAAVNAASLTGNGTVAPNSIASVFGKDLATQTANEGATLTTSLGGTTATVTDSTGVATPAPLFFVSPGQVNLAIPGGVADGAGQLGITSADGTNSVAAITVAPVAPGIFSPDGHLAAALALQVSNQGQQSYSLTFQYNASSSSYSAVPIDLGTSSDTTYLVLYGTGIRGAPLSRVSLQVGGVTIAPAYAGATGTFMGEDQVNILLPYSLKGAGDVTVTLTANGLTANPVHVTIQ